MRNNLVMRFRCSECGRLLNLCYEKDVDREKHDGMHIETSSPPEPTGAAMVVNNSLYIEPCRNCIEKHTGPAKKLAAAIKSLTEHTA